jgi:TldD protein
MRTARMVLVAVAYAFVWASTLVSFEFASAQTASTREEAEQDPILKAMLVELARNQSRLQLQNFEKPYFLEFRIDDVAEYKATSAFGAPTGEAEAHSRIAHVRVRVGSYKLDNSGVKPQGQLAILMQRAGIGGDGMVAIEVVDDDPVALRYGLWTAADTAYKQALDDYASKQAELKTIETQPQADDLAQAKPIISLEPIQHISIDRSAWKRNIVESSGLFLTDPSVKAFAAEIQTSEGSLEARVRTEYLVNSEGAIVRKSYSEYHAETAFTAQAADGMHLERSAPVSGTTAQALGTAQRFHDATLHALTGLDELCKAPLVSEEYHGPVLLAGNAAARSFADLFAHAVEARAPALGSSARTTGSYASSYQTRVLPETFKVVDDPTLTTLAKKSLIGAYTVDDEGVPAQKVTLVDSGKLVGYLMSREPIRDFPQSNGHGRAGSGQAPRTNIGVLEVEAANPVSEDALVKKLLDMGKDAGLTYVYLVETLGGPSRPRTLVRIKVADGSREVVRGGQLGDLDLRNFRAGILAGGDEPYVYNVFGDVPATVIAPPLLFDELTVKRAEEKNVNLPYYPPPN